MRATGQVELVEDDDAPEATPAPTRRRGLGLLVATAVVLVGALAAGQAVLDGRERAHLAELRRVPGVLEPLDDPRLLWSMTWGDTVTTGVRVGATLISAEVDDAGAVTLTGTAARTGVAAWTTRVTLPDEQRTRLDRDETERVVECLPLGSPEASDLTSAAACLVSARRGLLSSDEPAQLVVVDEAGAVASERTVHADLWGARGDHVILASVEGDDMQTWTVDAQTATGTPAWSRTLGPLAVPDEQLVGSGADRRLVAGAGCTVLTTGRSAVVLGEDGAVETSVTADAGDVVDIAPPCSVVVRTVASSETGSVVLPSGEELPSGVGAAFLLLDDRSGSGLLLTAEANHRLAARDPSSGAVAWQSTLTPDGGIRLDGQVYSAQGEEVVALDARTGAELWRTPVPFVPSGLVSDGRRLIVLGGDRFSLLDLAGGRLERTVDVRDLLPADSGADPDGDLLLYPWNGLLLAVSLPTSPGTGEEGRVWVIG